jgi:hypothetical protein
MSTVFSRSPIAAGAMSSFALAAFALPVSADTVDSARSFYAVSQVETAAGVVASQELLSLRSTGAATSLSVTLGDLVTPPVPVSFASDGEIETHSADPGIACYNMAAVLENAGNAPHPAPARVFFAFEGRVVPITLAVERYGGPNGTVETSGDGGTNLTLAPDPNSESDAQRPVGSLSVEARVDSDGATIEQATFVEMTLDSARRPINRTTCSVVHAAPASAT